MGLWAFWGVWMAESAMGFMPGRGPMTVWTVVKYAPREFSFGQCLLIVVRRRWVNIVLLAAE